MNYENLTDEQKEVYAYIIENYLKLNPIDKDKITPEVAKIVDDFMQDLYNCTKRLKIFTNIFKKANTILGLIQAVGVEIAKNELTEAFQKSVALPCYTTRFRAYANDIFYLIF